MFHSKLPDDRAVHFMHFNIHLIDFGADVTHDSCVTALRPISEALPHTLIRNRPQKKKKQQKKKKKTKKKKQTSN